MSAKKSPSSHLPLRIELALQGGGAHGAFTWGVLDRLLQDERFEIEGISGTSAGAMNAVVLADGLMHGGRVAARAHLERFWRKVSQTNAMSVLDHLVPPWARVWNPWTAMMAPWLSQAETLSGMIAPAQFNPLNWNPLRTILDDEVDFARVRACTKMEVYIAATNVRTGALREFRKSELNTDVVLASACLPNLFPAVEIEGEAYWDGGYTGNPSLVPLVARSPADDLLIVQINPLRRENLPVTSSEIMDRVNEITFNASLLHETLSLAQMQAMLNVMAPKQRSDLPDFFEKLKRLRLHRIGGDQLLANYGAASKLNTSWAFLQSLHDVGHATAETWILKHGDAVGKHSTIDLSDLAPPQMPPQRSI